MEVQNPLFIKLYSKILELRLCRYNRIA